RAKEDLHAAALMHRAVAQKPEVATKLVRVLVEDRGEMGRAGLLLPLQKKLHVDGELDLRRAQRIQRRHPPDERGLGARGGAAVEPPLGRKRRTQRVQGDLPARGAQRSLAQSGLKGSGDPVFRLDRLSVVVRVKDDGPAGAWRRELAEDDRRRALYAGGLR